MKTVALAVVFVLFFAAVNTCLGGDCAACPNSAACRVLPFRLVPRVIEVVPTLAPPLVIEEDDDAVVVEPVLVQRQPLRRVVHGVAVVGRRIAWRVTHPFGGRLRR